MLRNVAWAGYGRSGNPRTGQSPSLQGDLCDGGRCSVSADLFLLDFHCRHDGNHGILADGRNRSASSGAYSAARGIQRADDCFSDRLHGRTQAGACGCMRARGSLRGMGIGGIMVGRAVCAHAGSCASLLRACGIPSAPAQTMGGLLEVPCCPTLAARGAPPALAKRFLGHPVATLGKLYREVAVCFAESRAREAGRKR